MAAVDFFLKIDGIPGESKDSKHKDEIDISSWHWGLANSGGMEYGGGGGAGKVHMQDFSFIMKVNKATPKLIQACAGGDHIKKAVLTCRKAGKEQQEYLIITFSDLMISQYGTSASEGSPMPTESVSFNYSKVEYSYKEQKEDGTLGGAVAAGWDLKLNKKV